MACGHMLHADCLARSICETELGAVCPLCNQAIDKEERMLLCMRASYSASL